MSEKKSAATWGAWGRGREGGVGALLASQAAPCPKLVRNRRVLFLHKIGNFLSSERSLQPHWTAFTMHARKPFSSFSSVTSLGFRNLKCRMHCEFGVLIQDHFLFCTHSDNHFCSFRGLSRHGPEIFVKRRFTSQYWHGQKSQQQSVPLWKTPN